MPRDTFELLDDIEKELGIATCPDQLAHRFRKGISRAFMTVQNRKK